MKIKPAFSQVLGLNLACKKKKKTYIEIKPGLLSVGISSLDRLSGHAGAPEQENRPQLEGNNEASS